MTRISLAERAHQAIAHRLSAGDVAIDATVGNGHDTLFLANCVGDKGLVYGFDVQAQAITSTRQRLTQHGVLERVQLFQTSHQQMKALLPPGLHGRIKAVMFNLGYLPGADKSVITETATTLPALELACQLLMGQGVMTVMAYPGHAGGDDESQQVSAWSQTLEPALFTVEQVLSVRPQAASPRLFVIRKLS